MKGITPVIAVILLLLITVSMAGFAFVFLQRSLETATQNTEEQLQEQMNQQRQKFVIDNVNAVTNEIYIRHAGTAVSDTSKAAIYVNSSLKTCNWNTPGPWSPSEIRTCAPNPLITLCSGSTRIEVVGPAGRDSTTC